MASAVFSSVSVTASARGGAIRSVHALETKPVTVCRVTTKTSVGKTTNPLGVHASSDPEGSPAGHGETALAMEGIWHVVVLNDPVNLMSYVVMVFKKVFGFDDSTARRHMLEVHEQGRSVVWTGLREKAEAYAFTLQQWHLTAVLESDEAH